MSLARSKGVASAAIKGSAFIKVVEDVAKLLAGRSRSEARRWLVPDDFALLDKGVVISSWYDIRAYDRLSRLLLDVEGGGDPQYLRERGRATARRLLSQGLYAQLEYLQRTEASKHESPGARFEAFGRDLRLLTTLSSSMFNFSKWGARPDPVHGRRYLIEVTEARDFPEVLCWTSDGFVNEMGAQSRRDADLWKWERPTADRIVFRMQTDA
jgi:hypothetical protein